MSEVKATSVAVAAALVEALTLLIAKPFGKPPTTLGGFVYLVATFIAEIVLIVVSVSVTTVVTGTPYAGLIISLVPLSASSSLSYLLVGLASFVAGSLTAIMIYVIITLRGQRGVHHLSVGAGAPYPIPLASASVGLALQSIVPLNALIGELFISEVIYTGASIAAAVLVSLVFRRPLTGLLYGLVSSLGPLGLAIAVTVAMEKETLNVKEVGKPMVQRNF
jgi:hypothetical protein